MTLKIKNKHILSIDELEPKEITHLIKLGIELKKEKKSKPLLEGKTLAMIFEKPSTRTRVSLRLECFNWGVTL